MHPGQRSAPAGSGLRQSNYQLPFKTEQPFTSLHFTQPRQWERGDLEGFCQPLATHLEQSADLIQEVLSCRAVLRVELQGLAVEKLHQDEGGTLAACLPALQEIRHGDAGEGVGGRVAVSRNLARPP